MKRRVAFIILLATLVVCLAVFLVFHQTPTFRLSPEYYGAAKIEDIDLEGIRSLISEKKSFAVFAHQPGCQTSAALGQITQDFSGQHSLRLYQTNFSDLKASGLVPNLRFYPTFVIFRDGEVAAFLAADSDEDVAAFSSLDGFTKWFSKYVEV